MRKVKSYYLTIGLILLAVVISSFWTLTQQGVISFENQDARIVGHTVSSTQKIVNVDMPKVDKEVLVETELPKPIKEKVVQVKKIGKKDEIIPIEEINFIDEDDDGLYEKISWNTSGTLDEIFVIDLLILNPIEYLKDGDAWMVRFTTVGTANLSIWSENSAFEEIQIDLEETIDEMEFLNLSCGNQNLRDRLIVIDENNVSYKYSEIEAGQNIKPYRFLIEDYSCGEVGSFNAYMNIGGYAVLEFEFANEDVIIRQQAVDPFLLLETPETEILDDDDIYNSGSNTYLDADDFYPLGNYGDAFLKFNISNLTTSSVIESAEFCYVIRSGVMGGTEAETLEVYGVSNYTWTEEVGSTREMNIDQGTLILEHANPSVSVGSTACYDVTEWVVNETRDGKQNITIGLNLTEASADTSDDYVTFYSKEYGTAADRPYLNITYQTEKTLTITNPTTGSPESVSAYDNVTVSFNFSSSGVNETIGVIIGDVFVGGIEANIVEGNVPTYIFEDFETGTQNLAIWNTYQTPSTGARMNFSNTDYEANGSYGLAMDTTDSGVFALNVLYTNKDFTGASNINLEFWQIDPLDADEEHYAPDSWTGWGDYDVVAYTCDGNTWYEIVDAGILGRSTYTRYQINISADGDFCAEINSSFAIAFSQYDNYGFTDDGKAWDDINISYNINQEFAYYDASWNVNVTMPSGLSGGQNLFLNATHEGISRNHTQTNAITYGGATPPGSPISSCQTLSSANNAYYLTQNVTNAGTCFTISANNVTLDCNDYWINYSTGGGATTYGVFVNSADNVTVKNCNVIDGDWGSVNTDRHGIYFGGADDGVIYNNFVNISNSYAIRVYYLVDRINMTRNTAHSISSRGTYISSWDGYFADNAAYSSSSVAFDVGLGSKNNMFIRNNGTSDTNAGIFIYNSHNNTFIDCIGVSDSDRAVEFDNSDNNTIIELSAEGISSGSIGIFLDESEDNLFKDCVNITGVDYDVRVWLAAGSTNNTFLNCSYDLSKESIAGTASNEIIRKWYYQAYVNNSAGSAIENANISFYNSTGDLSFTALTNSSGWISRQNLTEYIRIDGTRTYQNNFSILANHSDYNNQTEQYNLSVELNNMDDFFTLTGEGSLTPQITWENPTPTDGDTINDDFVYLNTTVTYPSNSGNTSAWFDWNKSLLGYWSMDHYNSTHVFDNSSYSNLAEFTGSAFGTSNITTGARGNALDFDGIDDYLIAGDDDHFDIGTSNFTISFWVNPDTLTPATSMFLMCKHYGDNDNGFSIIQSSSTRRLRVYVNSSGADLSIDNFFELGWQHVVVTFTQTTGNITVYRNGIYNFSDTDTPWNINTNYPLTIGRRADSAQYYFDGELDEILVFNRTLSNQEALALYNNSANRLHTNLTSLSEGTYNYSAYAIDGDGNFVVDDDREVTLEVSTTLDDCQTITSPGNYILTQNVTNSGDCFDINSHNVTLDCADYWIEYATGGSSGIGIDVSGYDNATIKNCNVQHGSWILTGSSSMHAMQNSGADGTTVLNSYFNASNARAFYSGGGSNNLTMRDVYSYGDYHSATGGGLYVSSTDNSTFINVDGVSRTEYAWYLPNSDNNLFINSTGWSREGSYGFAGISYNNTFIDCTGNGSGDWAGFTVSGENNTFIRPKAYGTFAFWLHNANNTLIQDCVDVNNVVFNDEDTSYGVVLLNCSISSLADYISENWAKWYYQAYVNDTNGNPIANANISFYNTTGQLEFTALTNASGWIIRQNVTDEYHINTIEYEYSPYDVRVNHSDYNNQTDSYGLATWKNFVTDFFTLTTDSDNYLTIIDPTTGDPETVFPYDNITVKFNFTYAGVNQTSGVTMGDVFLDGTEASIVSSGAGVSTYVFEDFETGTQNTSLWSTYQTPASDAKMDFNYPTPANGSYSLAMYDHDENAGDYALNVLYTNKDFSGTSNINLEFWQYDPDDEQSNSPTGTWSGWGDYDAVAFTCDGNRWFEIVDATALAEASWTRYQVNISADGDFCAEINSSFSILFSQYDNYNITDDGRYWDDINISYISGESQEFAYYDASWNVNVTMPDGLTGYQDLFVNATYSAVTASDNESDAILYSDATQITSCQTISSHGNYIVTQNLTSSGTCIIINADNVSLDCDDYWINYSTGGGANTYGVYNANEENLTVKNCNVFDGSNRSTGVGADRHGIYFDTTTDSVILNNYVNTSNSEAIRTYDTSTNITLENNTAFSEDLQAIYFHTGSHNCTARNNTAKTLSASEAAIHATYSDDVTIIDGNFTSVGEAAIYFTNSERPTIIDVNATSTGDYGIEIRLNSIYANVTRSTVSSFYANAGYGYYAENTGECNVNEDNHTLINNNCTSSSGEGLTVLSDHNIFKNNIVFSSVDDAIYLSSASNNTFRNNTGRTTASGFMGLYMRNYGNNTIFTNHSAIALESGGDAIKLENTNNATFIDCVNITGNDLSIDYSGTSTNNTFINCSYDDTLTSKEDSSGGTLIRQWWFDGNVSNVARSPLENANMSLHNATFEYINTQLTDANGNINKYVITEYVSNNNVRTYYDNYTANTTLTDYVTNSTSYNLTIEGNVFNEVIMVQITDSCTYSGSGNWDISCSDYCNISSPVVIDGSNVSILGDGHTVVTENITGFQNIRVDGLAGHCTVTCIGGCFQTW